jgi:deazaflavin-dependent oxidoreductase (nitroreductase family)
MTTEKQPTAPVFVRTFWAIHRGIYRLTGGRLGPWRPKPGKRFGVMGLSTHGRRSGQPRLTMVGYFEDGPNLVSLAMNGWADAEPAWWLNLQAKPEATVMLKTGPRAVRARRASDAEHDRLWSRFDDFPGWGDDLDERVSKRSKKTPIVIFEPEEAEVSDDRDRKLPESTGSEDDT